MRRAIPLFLTAVVLAACPLFKSSETREQELRHERGTIEKNLAKYSAQYPNLAPLLRARWRRARPAYAAALELDRASERVEAMERALAPISEPLFKLWRFDSNNDYVLQRSRSREVGARSGKAVAGLVARVRSAQKALRAARPTDARLMPLLEQAARAAMSRQSELDEALYGK
jgi:hypothetical protein